MRANQQLVRPNSLSFENTSRRLKGRLQLQVELFVTDLGPKLCIFLGQNPEIDRKSGVTFKKFLRMNDFKQIIQALNFFNFTQNGFFGGPVKNRF